MLGAVEWGNLQIYTYLWVQHWAWCYCLHQGSPNLILEGLCPAEFSSNLPQHTSLEVSSIPSKTLISCFRCVWLGLELNSAGHRPSRTVSGDPWFTRSSRILRANVGSHAIVFKSFRFGQFTLKPRSFQNKTGSAAFSKVSVFNLENAGVV